MLTRCCTTVVSNRNVRPSKLTQSTGKQNCGQIFSPLVNSGSLVDLWLYPSYLEKGGSTEGRLSSADLVLLVMRSVSLCEPVKPFTHWPSHALRFRGFSEMVDGVPFTSRVQTETRLVSEGTQSTTRGQQGGGGRVHEAAGRAASDPTTASPLPLFSTVALGGSLGKQGERLGEHHAASLAGLAGDICAVAFALASAHMQATSHCPPHL